MNVRPPSWDDLEEVARLVADCDVADTGRIDMTLDDLRRDWSNPDVDLALRMEGGRVVFTRKDGRPY